MRYVFCAVWLFALGASACVETVNVEFTSCEHEGVTLQIGEVVPSADGCGSCTCEPNGMVSCDERTCCLMPDGSTVSPGVEWTDGCTTCECEEDGSLGCSSGTSCACSAPPVCETVSGCTGTPICDDASGWTCAYECTCDPTNVPICDTPSPTCTTELFCDEETDTWVCGLTTCDCVGSPGECASVPGCTSTLVCDPGTGAWYCEDDCPCGSEYPNCGAFASPACVMDTWVCESPGNTTCGEVAPACPFHEDFNCANLPVCDALGMGAWSCTEDCLSEYCPGEPPSCPPDFDQCSYFQLCQLSGWECVLHCN